MKNALSLTPTKPNALQMTVMSEPYPVILDGQAAPFIPVQGNILTAPLMSIQGPTADNFPNETGIWAFLTALQGTMDRQQQEIQQLSLKCQHLEYKNTDLEQKVAMQENSIAILEKKSVIQEEKVCELEHTLEKMRANMAQQPQSDFKQEISTSGTWASKVRDGHTQTNVHLDKGKKPEDGIDANEYQERERRAQNIVIRGLPEKEKETPLSLAKDIGEFFGEHFAMQEVVVFGAHRVGRKRDENLSHRAIVCTMLDTRKREIILDSSRIYLKGTSFYVTEDRTPRQQEERRRMYEARIKKREQGAEQDL